MPSAEVLWLDPKFDGFGKVANISKKFRTFVKHYEHLGKNVALVRPALLFARSERDPSARPFRDPSAKHSALRVICFAVLGRPTSP